MKKITLIITIFLVGIILYSCHTEKPKASDELTNSDLTRLNLKGNVKSLTDSRFEASGKQGEIQKGIRISKEVLNFDEKGNKTENFSYGPNDSLEFKTKFKHDDKGFETEALQYKPDGSLCTKTITEYFKGNKRASCVYDEDGRLSWRITYLYDDDNNITEEDYFRTVSKADHKNIYKYDAKGNVTALNSCNEDGSIVTAYTYKYEFDKKGNWIKKTEYMSGTPLNITDREIIYYN